MNPKERAEDAVRFLQARGCSKSGPEIWDAAKIKELGHDFGQGATLVVAYKGDYEWPWLYCIAQEPFKPSDVFYEPGSGWALCIYSTRYNLP